MVRAYIKFLAFSLRNQIPVVVVQFRIHTFGKPFHYFLRILFFSLRQKPPEIGKCYCIFLIKTNVTIN